MAVITAVKRLKNAHWRRVRLLAVLSMLSLTFPQRCLAQVYDCGGIWRSSPCNGDAARRDAAPRPSPSPDAGEAREEESKASHELESSYGLAAVKRGRGRINGSAIPIERKSSRFAVHGMPLIEAAGKKTVITAALSQMPDTAVRYSTSVDRPLHGNLLRDEARGEKEQLLTLSTKLVKHGRIPAGDFSACLCVAYFSSEGALLFTHRACNALSREHLERYPDTAAAYVRDQVPVSGEIARKAVRFEFVYYEAESPLGLVER